MTRHVLATDRVVLVFPAAYGRGYEFLALLRLAAMKKAANFGHASMQVILYDQSW